MEVAGVGYGIGFASVPESGHGLVPGGAESPGKGSSRGVPKLREILRNSRKDSETPGDSPDGEFEYGDSDCYTQEMSELYSYTEAPEFALNRMCLEEEIKTFGKETRWMQLDQDSQKLCILKLLNGLEVTNRDCRLRVTRAILYLSQGVFGECDTESDVLKSVRRNIFMLHKAGTFSALVDLLSMEIDNSQALSSALRKPAISLADSTELRVLLNIMNMMVETMCHEYEDDSKDWILMREAFRKELGSPVCNNEPFAVLLFTMVTKFCSGHAPHFPMKKVLLLLWKVVLFSAGGFEDLQEAKVCQRQELGLLPMPEDSIRVTRGLRASSPPASAADLIDQQQQRRARRPKRGLAKQDSLDAFNETDPYKSDDIHDDEDYGDENDSGIDGEVDLLERDEIMPPVSSAMGEKLVFPKGLPWAPKVREKDIENFLEMSRSKFIGYQLGGDTDTIVGLPRPIHESVKILKQHKYVSVAEVQIKNEEELLKMPLSKKDRDKDVKMIMGSTSDDSNCLTSLTIRSGQDEERVEQTPAETLYQGMLPNLPQYMILSERSAPFVRRARESLLPGFTLFVWLPSYKLEVISPIALLKILLAAAPTSKAKTDSINILADVLPEEMPITVLQSMKLGVDVNRHKEIIVKAISALLLLLLKHFKLNHIYQFEYISQHLVFANCIPLILKFFNQNIMSYIAAKNSIADLDFPHFVVHDLPDLTAESLEAGDDNQFCWRNLFSCINLLRILNKLTKWKHSRTMMLVVFKSAPILKRALKVKQAVMQLYILKLLKVQTKYLGRQWRKSNMKTMSAIYQKVRHRLNDDWAYGNDIDARPWDFQAEECALRAGVEQFNRRRYESASRALEFSAVDTCAQSVLGHTSDLPEEFNVTYERWLEREVFSDPIRWEELLQQ